jgi:hypothetical protein
MNTIFDFNRVVLLLRRRFALAKRQLAINLLTMLGIATLLIGTGLTIAWYQGEPYTNETIKVVFSAVQTGVFTWFVCISGSIFAGQMFTDFGSKDQGIANLMLPATHFEKWLVAFLISTIYFLVAVLATFIVAEFVNIFVFNAIRPVKIDFSSAFDVFQSWSLMGVLKIFFTVHSVFFFGSIFFNSSQTSGNQWWKTALAVMGIGLVLALIDQLLPYLLWPRGTSIKESAGINYISIKNDGIYSISKSAFWDFGDKMLYFFLPPVLWFLSYLKLTEKQI